MSLLNETTNRSSEERDIELRTRSDLIVNESVYQGEACWIIKDPLAMKYFRIREPEFLVLNALRSKTNYAQLKRNLLRNFPEQTVRVESIQQLIVGLHRNGLLITRGRGQAKPLAKRKNKELRQKLLGLLSSLVSLRLPGFDPESLLNWLYPKFRWFYSAWFTFIVFAVCLAAGGLVLSKFTEFYSRLPDFQSFFAFDNILFMGAILIFTKTIHEFGHGLTCKHFGGECHEIGFMFLVLMPAMYCNTSDSWILPNKWHRIAIGAAGMYVEVFMAAICTFVWWYTHPGWIHYLCLNVMFLSSVSTIIFNINPLLRYDGYYMLSDYLEIPNLAQKSKTSLLSKLRVSCLGMQPTNARLLPQRNLEAFAIYSVASFVYKWVIMIFIFWFISTVFEPLGLAAVGHFVIGVSLIGMVVVPMWKMFKFFSYPGRMREVKKVRFVITSLVLLGSIAALCLIKFPHFVGANFVLQPLDPQRVVVTQAGVLSKVFVKPGDLVVVGDDIAELENLEIELELNQLIGELARLNNDLSGYQLTRNKYLDSGKKIAETIAAISNVEKQIELKQRQANRLTLKAMKPGVVIAPPNVVANTNPSKPLGTWKDSPLDNANLNSSLEPDTLLCMIAVPKAFEVILVVDESNIELVQPEQNVVLLLEQHLNQHFRATISEVSQTELTAVPRELSQTNGGALPVKPDGSERPLAKSFEAKATVDFAELEQANIVPKTGYYGIAKIRVGEASAGSRLLRYLRSIINFR